MIASNFDKSYTHVSLINEILDQSNLLNYNKQLHMLLMFPIASMINVLSTGKQKIYLSYEMPYGH